jgi:hypothetical protein
MIEDLEDVNMSQKVPNGHRSGNASVKVTVDNIQEHIMLQGWFSQHARGC